MSTTMEQVEALPEGRCVVVDGVQWSRVPGGLQNSSGVTLELRHFKSYVELGRLSVTANWVVGRWYQCSGDLRLVTRRTGATIHALRFTGGTRVSPNVEAYEETTSTVGWVLVETDSESVWLKRIRAVESLVRGTVPDGLVTALHDHAADVEDDSFDETLNNWGIGRQIDHTTKVTITGRSDWTPDESTARAWLGDNFEVSDVEDVVQVHWSREVQITRTGFGCTCDEIDGDDVSGFLPAYYEEFDYEVECAD